MAQSARPATGQSSLGGGFTISKARSLWLPALVCFFILCLETFVLLHDLGGSGRKKTQGALPVASFQSSKNEVRQKNAGTILWQPPTPGQILYQQDSIATMSDSEARVRFADQSELIIEPDSLIVFEEIEPASNGKPGIIRARLLRGSIRRKNTGPMDLLIKTSDDPRAVPYVLSDTHGGAIFRVISRVGGIEVIVESGGVLENGVPVVPKNGHPKLPSPNLRKPTIEIKKIENPSSTWNFFKTLFEFPEAEAAETHWNISIHFAWDNVPGASAYRVQVSSDPEFQSITREVAVNENDYEYQTAPPEKPQALYMRVAGVDPSGNLGEFSPVETVHIRSLSEISGESHETLQSGTRIAVVPLKPKSKPEPSPSPSAETKPETVATGPEYFSSLDLSYGIVEQSRTFENSGFPTSASASGFVPAEIRAEYTRMNYERGTGFKAGGSYLLEVVTTGSSGATLVSGKQGVPVFQAWYLFEKNVMGLTGGLGPYLTNTSQFSYSLSSLTSTTKVMGGALLDFDPDIERIKSIRWHGDLGILAIGGFGVDASMGAQTWFLEGPRVSLG